ARRIHRGTAGGPDAFGCFSCHSKGGLDGAGTQSQNAFLRGDGERTGGADQRNAPHLLGLGPIACLAREMSAELQAQAAGARERAKAEGHRVEQALTTKGVSFGRIAADPDGTLEYGSVEGVDPSLTIRPFGWNGHQGTLRAIADALLPIHPAPPSNSTTRSSARGNPPSPIVPPSSSTSRRTATGPRSSPSTEDTARPTWCICSVT